VVIWPSPTGTAYDYKMRRNSRPVLQHLPIHLQPIDMKFSSAFFVILSSFVLTGFALTPVETVKSDVNDVLNQVSALNRAINQLHTKGATDEQFSVCKPSTFNSPPLMMVLLGY